MMDHMDNILDSDARALINTVNTVGVMGAGLALQIKRLYPGVYELYRIDCKRGLVQTGQMHVVPIIGNRYIINFPTKRHWKNTSQLTWIEDGLVDLRRVIADFDIESIAIPPLGCGLGGLNWDDVRPLIEHALAGSGVDVEMYQPNPLPLLRFRA